MKVRLEVWHKGQRHQVTVSVNFQQLAKELVIKARRNKSRVSRVVHGAVAVKHEFDLSVGNQPVPFTVLGRANDDKALNQFVEFSS